MPITRGQAWGEPAPVPADALPVGSDAAAAQALEEAEAKGAAFPVLLLRGGDLCRTLGGTPGGEPAAVRFTVDVGQADLDGRPRLFVAHLVVHSATWRRAFVAMNAQWLGSWNLGPRAHPGDGLLDSYDADLPPDQLLAVRSRLPLGTHLPHPGIRERRAATAAVDLGRRRPVRLDGRRAGRARRVSVQVRPDALVVYV